MTDRNVDIHLGYAVPEGGEVRIPLNHTVITGQTQMAGKTTALEALLSRAPGRSAVAFMTKRGEGAFFGAHAIQPFFQEQADWRYVAAILEASRGEKMRMERAWIIRASKGAHSLADVQRNVRDLMAKSRPGFQQDMYLVLDAYLEIVVPQISAVLWARTVELEDGLNVMDLSLLADEMQHLVIRSTIEWVLKHGNGVTVVVPEAWKFLPQGRGTPVKLAAEAYIRQGAALANYLWLDSQDIAGVEKLILKSCPIWLLGVQRESNEIKRTLAQIPASVKKPKSDEIATLELGQFFVCYGKHTIKTYVRPVWMVENDARAVAVGAVPLSRIHRPSFHGKHMEIANEESFGGSFVVEKPYGLREADVNVAEAEELRRENALLKEEIRGLRETLHRQDKPPSSRHQAPASLPEVRTPQNGDAGNPAGGFSNGNTEALYAYVRDRLAKEAPKLLKVAMTRPEIDVEVQVETITATGDSWIGWTARLLKEGFFKTPQKSGAVFKEAARRGATGVGARADEACKKLLAWGFLTREESGYQEVAGMKVHVR